MIRIVSASMAGAALLGFVIAAAARAAEPAGVEWETSSRLVTQGMPSAMPPQTSKTCAPKEWARPPQANDPNCKSTDFKKVGNQATWRVECTGEMKMSGVGQMTFSDAGDSYTGQVEFTGSGMNMKSSAMNMTVKLSGRKTGTCAHPQ